MATTSKHEAAKARVSARRVVDERKSGFDKTTLNIPEGLMVFQPKQSGAYRLDIMPFIAGEGNPYADAGVPHYERTYFTHRGIGPNNDSYVCPAKTFNKPCPICEARAKLMKDGGDEEAIKDLGPKQRQLFLIIDHAARDRGLQLWDVSWWLFGKPLEAKIRNADEGEYDYFADLNEGKYLKIGAEEKSFAGQKFLEFNDIEFKDRKEHYDDDMMEKAPCLDDLLKEMEYDKLKAIYNQTSEEDDEVEDDDVKPVKKGKATTKKTLPPPDDDDDEFEEDDEEEEDTEENEEDEDPTAMDKGIEQGFTVQHKKHGVCTVVKVSKDGTSLLLRDAKGKTIPAVSPSDVDVTDIDEDEEEEKPAPKKGAKKPPVEEEDSEDEDEDSEDEEEDSEDEEDEKPAPKKGGGKKAPPPPDDDEDDWEDEEDTEDEEEEEDKPAPKKGAKKK